ncbi:hypothetical protein ABGB17_36775 [Sphaerisporangium sp. B11E5]|uniref:hypothetical protein n=1 Tax=Sphaerisporangium sp. B11E5 TaxID=3153563 RepID=UPI00325D9C8A
MPAASAAAPKGRAGAAKPDTAGVPTPPAGRSRQRHGAPGSRQPLPPSVRRAPAQTNPPVPAAPAAAAAVPAAPGGSTPSAAANGAPAAAVNGTDPADGGIAVPAARLSGEAAEKVATVEPDKSEKGDKDPKATEPTVPPQAPKPARPARKGSRGRRASVPTWDEIMFGARRQE